jgi:hypothetical protein
MLPWRSQVLNCCANSNLSPCKSPLCPALPACLSAAWPSSCSARHSPSPEGAFVPSLTMNTIVLGRQDHGSNLKSRRIVIVEGHHAVTLSPGIMADNSAQPQAPDSASPVKMEASAVGRLSPTKDKKEHFPHNDPGPFKAHFLALSSKRKDDWQVRIAAMQGIKALLDDGSDKGNAAFFSTFRPGVQPLLEQLNDVKPKVPLVACEVLTSFSNVTGKSKEFEGVFVDYVIPSLLNHVYTKSNPALATASQSVLVAIVSGSVFPRSLDRLIAGATSKIAELKQRSLELTILAMQKWPAVAFSRHASKLGAVIIDAVQVGNIETRDIGRKAMTQFHALFPDEAAKHLSEVDEHTLKQLESVMPGAKASAAAAAVAREPSASFAPPKPKPKPKPKVQDSEPVAPAAIASNDGADVAIVDIPGNSSGELAIKLQKCEAALKSERASKKRQQEMITALEDKIRTMETEAKSKDAAKDEGHKEEAGALVKARGEAVTAKKRAATLEKRVLELQGVVDKQEALLNTVNKRLEEMAGIVESRAALAKECEETKSKLEELDSEYVGAQQRWKEREREWFDKRTQLEEQVVELETQLETSRLEHLKLQGDGRAQSRQSNHASFDATSPAPPPSRGHLAPAGGRDSVDGKRQGGDAAEWAHELGDQHANSPQMLAPAALKPRPPTGPTRMQSPRAISALGQQQLQQALTELEDVRAQLVVLSEEAAETTRQLGQQQTGNTIRFPLSSCRKKPCQF